MALDPFKNSPVLHRAEWVVPVSSAPVRDGAVLIGSGRVLASGSFAELKKDCPAGTRVEDHGKAALMPALVNAHTHLELSVFKGSMEFPAAGFPDWLGKLYSLRGSIEKDAVEQGFKSGELELLNSGTALCGDITNGGMAGDAHRNSDAVRLERQVFLELLGFNLDTLTAAIPAGIDPESDSASPALVPHSVYSASARIIAAAKEWSLARGLPFSIHTAEHPEEIEFLREGTGFCREFLQSLGKWPPGWTAPRKTPVEYLHGLGVLDSTTILVHAVHMRESDWALAASNQCAVLFCPRSNRNLSAGRPDIEKALSRGIRTALGTDSLASNTDLSLFCEAAFVLDNYPAIDPGRVVEMITLNPADALGRKGVFGSIEPGAKANLLAVSIQHGVDESNIAEALIRYGKEGALKWVSPA
ncbi:MAG: amidohydrolase family protein [Syntrophobacteraceae bacterium]